MAMYFNNILCVSSREMTDGIVTYANYITFSKIFFLIVQKYLFVNQLISLFLKKKLQKTT